MENSVLRKTQFQKSPQIFKYAGFDILLNKVSINY